MTTEANACALCDQQSPLVKSHIIPEAFYRTDVESGQGLMFASSPNARPSKSPIGEYDRIVCASCERRFSSSDDYAASLLLGRLWKPASIGPPGTDVNGCRVEGVDYARLKLFGMSLLWRAHASRRTFFSRVDVGPYEPRLRGLLLAGDAGSPDDFAVHFSRFVDSVARPTPPILSPVPMRMKSVNLARFCLGETVMLIKTDSRPAPPPLSFLLLRPGEPMLVSTRPFIGSQEYHIARAMVDVPDSVLPPRWRDTAK